MSLYVPATTLQALKGLIADSTYASLEEAYAIAQLIGVMAVQVGDQALDEAIAFTKRSDAVIRDDIDSSLNMLSDWTGDQLDMITDTYGSALTVALTSLGDAQTTAGDAIADGLEGSYNLVAESYEVAAEYVETSVDAASSWVTESVDSIGGWVLDSFTKANDIVSDIIGSLKSGLTGMIDYALEVLLPAQGEQWNFLVGKMLMSDPLTGVLYSLKELFVEGLGETFSIDEKEMSEWMKRTFATLQNLALADVKG